MDDQFNREAGQNQSGGYDSGDYGSAGSAAATAAARIKEQAAQVKDKVADLGRKAGDKMEEQRIRAAGTLDQTASALHEGGDRIASSTSKTMHAAADKIQSASDYLREHDAQAMMNDLQNLVRRHPGPTLAAAVVVGFLAGRALRSGD